MVKEGYVKPLSRKKWKAYITNMTTVYGFEKLNL